MICGRVPSLIAAFPAAVGIWTFVSTRMSGLLYRLLPLRTEPMQPASEASKATRLSRAATAARPAILCRRPPAGQWPARPKYGVSAAGGADAFSLVAQTRERRRRSSAGAARGDACAPYL